MQTQHLGVELLEIKLNLVKEKAIKSNSAWISYLLEQSKIARALDIENNVVNFGSLGGKQNSGDFFVSDLKEFPYYLFGHNAITLWRRSLNC